MWFIAVLGGLIAAADIPGTNAYLQGTESYRAEKYDEAIRAFEIVRAESPTLRPWANVRIGMCLDGQNKDDGAAGIYQAIISGEPGPWKAMARGKMSALASEREDYGLIVEHLSGFERVAPAPWWMDRYLWQFSEAVLNRPGDRRAGYSFFRETVEDTWYIKPRLDAARFLVRSPAPLDQSTALLGMLRSSAYTDVRKRLPNVTVTLSDEENRDVFLRTLAAQLTDNESANDAGAIAIARRHASNPAARFLVAYAARLQASRKAFARAESLSTELAKMAPDSREAGETLWWLGNALERAEKVDDAKRVHAMLPARCKDHFRADDALMRLGEIYLAEGAHKKGLQYLVQLGREYPESRFRAHAYYICATHKSVQGDKTMQRSFFDAAAKNNLGKFYAHRSLRRIHQIDGVATPVNLEVDGANPILSPFPDLAKPLPDLPEPLEAATEYRRLRFFGQHGLEESEWEALPLLLSVSTAENPEAHFRIMAEAGLAHTALQFAADTGWGVDKSTGEKSVERLRLEYPRAYWPEVTALCKPLGLDPYLILSVARQESTFRPNLTSHAGASGVMQLMPSTAKWLAKADPNIETRHVANLESPVNSLRLGTFYVLRMLERSNGNLVDTLASYNGGPGNRDKWRKRFPNHDLDEFVEAIPFEETKSYVKKVLGNYAAYRSLYAPVS
jgi:TolA-binding protein